MAPRDACGWRMSRRDTNHDSRRERGRVLAQAVTQVERAARELASAEVDVILQAGTAIAFFRGLGHDSELCRRITARTGIKSTTSFTAVAAAMNALGIKNPAIATTYIADIDARLVEVLEKSGIQSQSSGMDIKRSIPDGQSGPDATYRLAREVARSAPEPTVS